MKTAIWWIRRDLRLADNEALNAAFEGAAQVVPLFIIDPRLLSSSFVGEKRLAFLWGGLRELAAALRERGSKLVIREGNPTAVLQDVRQEAEADKIFALADFSPYARSRDKAVAERLPLQLLPGTVVQHPDTIEKKSGGPYTVFTPYGRTWRERPFPTETDILSAPIHIETPAHLNSLPLPQAPALPASVPFQPGEAAAQRRLDVFLQGNIAAYKTDRNALDTESTSGLSPYLRFGMLSARQAVVAALAARGQAETEQARAGADTWLNELIWREFYVSILYHFPQVMQGNFRPEYDRIRWRNDEEEFAAWCNGRTGYPVVDAAMRRLRQSGWMHNRARMIVASFLVKDLLIDWRWGERWFMQHLIDGDPAANNGGWQWAAGTGTDAAPYFRIFNPVSQSQKHDPNGEYIRRWVPELRRVGDEYIHEPWKMPPLEQKRSGCEIGKDYPRPIVDHKQARERTLAAYKAAREENDHMKAQTE